MKGALGHPLEGKRLERWMALLSTMRPADAPAIAALLDEEQRLGRAFPAAATAFWQAWADLDATGAWSHVQANADAGGKQGSEPFMKAWAFGDPRAATEAFRQLGDSPLADGAFSGLMHGLAESDPGSAVAFAATLPEDRQIDAAVHVSGSMIYMLGNEGVQAWFDALPATTPTFNKEAARVVMESLSRSDPGSVESFAMARLDQQWSSRPAEQNFAASMILRNGGSPWNYVASAMDKHPRPEEPLALATWVARLNPQSALDWADSNPDSPATDRILAGLARHYQERGFLDMAGELAPRIREPAIRRLLEQE